MREADPRSDWVAPEAVATGIASGGIASGGIASGGIAQPGAAASTDPGGADATGLSSGVDQPVPSTGIAVARGDARAPRRSATRDLAAVGSARTARPGDRARAGRDGEDPAARLAGNPLRSLAVVGPGGVLDGAFDLLRFGFRRFLALAAVLFLPLQLLDLWIALSSGTTSSANESVVLQLLDGGGDGGWALVVAVLQAVALFLLGMAAGHLVAGWLDGRDDPFGTVVGAVARRAWVAPIVVVVALLAKGAAACLGGVGFFLVDALLFVAGPVAGGERLGPGRTLGRSVRLARRSYGQALVVCVGGFLITLVLRFALGLGPLVLVSMLGLPEEWSVALEQAGSLTLLITLPLTACIAARAHVDLQCRAEGFDLVRREEARGLR